MGIHGKYGFILHGKKYFLFQTSGGNMSNLGAEFITWLRDILTEEHKLSNVKENIMKMKFLPLTKSEKQWCSTDNDEYRQYTDLFVSLDEMPQNDPDYEEYDNVADAIARYFEYGFADYYATLNECEYSYIIDLDNDQFMMEGNFGKANMNLIMPVSDLLDNSSEAFLFSANSSVEFW